MTKHGMTASSFLACLLLLTLSASAGIHRSHSALVAFAGAHPCPSTGLRITSCPGHVIDHIVPLCADGQDRPSNMQWQEYEQSLIKDKDERRLCARLRRGDRQ